MSMQFVGGDPGGDGLGGDECGGDDGVNDN